MKTATKDYRGKAIAVGGSLVERDGFEAIVTYGARKFGV